MFRNREDAASQLAQPLKSREWRDPLVLGIPRGGVVTGAVLARELGAELDILLSRKLRAPMQAELAIGAISEDGHVYLDAFGEQVSELHEEYVDQEKRHQLAEIARRKKLFRSIRPQANVRDRSVIVTDDGIATGSTMIAALQALRLKGPYELIVAVPVGSSDAVAAVRRWCDEVVCLHTPEDFFAIGLYYEDFTQVEDDQVIEILRSFAPHSGFRTLPASEVLSSSFPPLEDYTASSQGGPCWRYHH